MNGKQRKAARLLGLGVERTKVARMVGVSVKTLYNWNTSGMAFREAVEQARSAQPSDAEVVLSELLDSESESIRLRAAEALLKRPSGAEVPEDPALGKWAAVS